MTPLNNPCVPRPGLGVIVMSEHLPILPQPHLLYDRFVAAVTSNLKALSLCLLSATEAVRAASYPIP